jgi:hypothetical protein
MKKLFAMLLAALMLCSFAACNTTTVETGTEEPGQVAEAQVQTAGPAAAAAPDRGYPDRSDMAYSDVYAGSEKTDWTAEWIWTKYCPENSYVAFRKTFTLDSEVASATAYISSVDKYTLWVNGELTVIDGCLKRGPTPHDCYYDTVELTNLRQGENTLAILVAFNGKDGDGSVTPLIPNEDGDLVMQAGLLFEMNAGGTAVKTDSTWKAIRHAAYRNRQSAGADFVAYTKSSQIAEANIWYDANADIGAWTAANFDDNAWEDATPIAKAGQLPYGGLFSAATAPIKFYELQDFLNASDYAGKTLTEDTALILELPGNIQFNWYIELEAPQGKHLTFYTDTYQDREGIQNFKDTYITKDGAQAYENYPWRSGSKLIVEAEAGVTFTRLAYRYSEYNGEKVGSFTSSDAALDQLWQECLNTVTICMRDTFMDCPDRERGPYMGDATNEIDSVFYSYDGAGYAMARKAILNCVGWTPADFAIPSRCPSVKPSEIPNQSLIFVGSVYRYWQYSGDAETAKLYLDAFINYLKLYELDEKGLEVYRNGAWTWNEWGNNIDADLLQKTIFVYAAKTAQNLAAELGVTEYDAFLHSLTDGVKETYYKLYFGEDGFKSPDMKKADERVNAMAILAGLVEEKDYDLFAESIMNTCEASPFMEKYVEEALCILGHEDLALKRMTERYAPMLTDEWDTIWERFEDTIGTTNHAWSTAPLYIISRYAAGAHPTAPGWETYEIAPSDVVGSFTCTVWTPKGNITIEKNGDILTITAVEGGTLILADGSTVPLAVGTQTYALGNP